MRISGEVKLPAGSEEKAKGKLSSLRSIFAYLAPYKVSIFFAALALIFTSGAVLGIGQGVRYLVDEGIGKGDASLLNQSFIVLVGITLFLAVATFARYFLVTWIGERVVADIRRDVYGQLIKQDVAFFETNRTGELLSRLTTDTTLLQTVVGSSVSIALRNALLLIGGCTMLLITSLRLSEYVFIMVPVVVIPIIVLGKKVRALSRQTQEKVADISVHAEETISSIRTIQSLSLESHENSRFGSHVKQVLDTSYKRIKLRSLLTAIVISLVLGAVAMVLFMGGHDVINGTITAGELSAFLFYAMLVAGSTGAISEVIGDLQRAAGATERLMELKQIEPTIAAPENPAALPSPCTGEIAFNNVTFCYPSRPDTKATDDVTITIKSGEKVALVGPSGAGKSTWFHLLGRAYDPGSGSITIDGIDIKTLEPEALRRHIGLVPQDASIFSTTAYENIQMGRIDATREDVLRAAEQAEALEFLEALPDGLETYVGEKGVRLSGGQKQRIAIARALIRNPDILLLDEATSALDSENERNVQKALETLMEGRTTLMIAHRLATVQHADRIIVLDEGKIQATGTHSELEANNKLYARLAKLQFKQQVAA